MNGVISRYRVVAEPLRTERRIEAGILVVVALLLALLLWILLRAIVPGGPDPMLPAPASLAVEPAVGISTVTSQGSEQIRSRPLFWSSRRASQLPRSVAGVERDDGRSTGGVAAPRLKNLEVTGVYGGDDGGGAIISYKGKAQRVSLGDSIDGWKLTQVGHNEVLWVSGAGRDRRQLTPQPVVAAAPTSHRASVPEPAGASEAREPRAQDNPEPGKTRPAQERTLSLGGLTTGGRPPRGSEK